MLTNKKGYFWVMLTSESKKLLFEQLVIKHKIFDELDSNEILNFVHEIWKLEDMPSTDGRYKNALEDFTQHAVRNNDWDINYIFIDRLSMLSDEEHFKSFLENVLNPKYRKSEAEILELVSLINRYLEKDGFKLVITNYSENGLPIFMIHRLEVVSYLPLNVKLNNIPFIVIKSPNGNSNKISSHPRPDIFPAFVLVFNDGWNDYGIQTCFDLFYYDNLAQPIYLGVVKIMLQSGNIIQHIPERFDLLDPGYCSMGQSERFYIRIKNVFGKDYEGILYALKDVALFPQILEEFDNNKIFKESLIRYDSIERLLREIKHKLNGQDIANMYNFIYKYHPPFSEGFVNMDFQFSSEIELPNRIYAIIGKNGCGKTQFITSLPNNISKKTEESFIPSVPLFSKVIAVSYSIFDRFEIPKKSASFNYIYCGLRLGNNEPYSEQKLYTRFYETLNTITRVERVSTFRRILMNFIDTEFIDQFIINEKDPLDRFVDKIDVASFDKIKNKLSSGQNIILFIVSEIVANIRFDSLLLFDEPETHLHPNAITQLMNTIYELVKEFQSYCIITTHSPLIIRELFSKNVYVMERFENNVTVRKIPLESFGENLTILTDEVFDNKETTKQYKKIITKLVNENMQYEEIISLLENKDMALGLNTRLYVKSLIKGRNEKPGTL